LRDHLSAAPRSPTAIGTVLLLCVAGCSVRTLPPPSRPTPLRPAIDPPDDVPSEGSGNVFIATDVPAAVESDTAAFSSGADVGSVTTLCSTTPCVVAMHYGPHEIKFRGLRDEGRWSSARIDVDGPRLIVNHTLGQDRISGPKLWGGVLLGTGLGLGLVSPAGPSLVGVSEEVQIIGITLAVIQIAIGSWILVNTTRTMQDGATTQWVPTSAEMGALPMPGRF
jgi:hypothetical protein